MAEQATKNLADAEERAAKAADGGADDVSRFAGSFDGFGDKIKGGVSDLGKFTAAAAGIGSAIGLGMAAMDNMDIESKLAAQLGATGDLAAEYGDRAGALYRSGVAGSMEEAAQAVGLVANSFRTAGFEGEASMDQIASNAMTFANVFDQDVSASVQTASQLIQNGLARTRPRPSTYSPARSRPSPRRCATNCPRSSRVRDELPRARVRRRRVLQPARRGRRTGQVRPGQDGDALKEFTIRATDGSKSQRRRTSSSARTPMQWPRASPRVRVGAARASTTAQKLLRHRRPGGHGADRHRPVRHTPRGPVRRSDSRVPEALTGRGRDVPGFAGSTQQMSDTVNSGRITR
ncbi:hypothetical protein GS432_18715 [Rhodococcus hoagii]|nr:hypothetical protein [Prescottella equi]